MEDARGLEARSGVFGVRVDLGAGAARACVMASTAGSWGSGVPDPPVQIMQRREGPPSWTPRSRGTAAHSARALSGAASPAQRAAS